MCLCLCMTLLTLKEFVEFHEIQENVMPFEATPTHNIKFPKSSCVTLRCRRFVYNPEIVYITGSLRKRNVFRCYRFREYDKLWGCVTSVFIYTEVACEILYTYRSWHTTVGCVWCLWRTIKLFPYTTWSVMVESGYGLEQFNIDSICQRAAIVSFAQNSRWA